MNRKQEYDIYTDYYVKQAGSGFSNIYAGPVYQKGYGVGSFLGGLFRTIYPLIKKGSLALGSELLKSGVGVMSDLTRNEPVETAIKKRGKEVVHNLGKRSADHMFGSGYKTTLMSKRRQSTAASRGGKKRKVTKKKKQIKKKNTSRKRPTVSKNRRKISRNKTDLLSDIFS